MYLAEFEFATSLSNALGYLACTDYFKEIEKSIIFYYEILLENKSKRSYL